MQTIMMLRMAGVSIPPQLMREPYDRGYRGPEPIVVSVSAGGLGVKAPRWRRRFLWALFTDRVARRRALPNHRSLYGTTVNGIEASVVSQSSASVPLLPPSERKSILNVSTGAASVFRFIFVRPKSRDES